MSEGASDIELRRRQFKSQISNVQSRKEQAVCVRHAFKKYGSKNNTCIVLDNLNMTVPKGAIYGLLGASGCGKTTLINCIVGRKNLNSGEIWVLGGKPGSRGSGVPGPRVGYMPQEMSLFQEFSIRETLKYFGWILDMKTEQIEQRLSFLVNLFMLPEPNRLVKNLSYGQQRRVSLAATLLHEPELLILDEPTVGVDPLLRHNIWKHLVEITKHGKTTVILTTHYIDEARQAHLIGLMRGGYFLAEENPEKLIARYNADTLESVFLKLSVIQNLGNRRRSSILQNVQETIQSGAVNEAAVLDEPGTVDIPGDTSSVSSKEGIKKSIEPIMENTPPELPPEEEQPPMKCVDYFRVLNKSHMHAMIWKNFLWMWRNWIIMIFITGLPLMQTILFCLSIGHDPKGLPFSVVNHELEESEMCRDSPGCNSTRLSCNYLKFLERRTHHLDFFGTEEEAIEKVKRGKAWATLVFASNFSDSIKSRIDSAINVPEWDLITSSVEVHQDKSNEYIANYIQRDLYFAFEHFLKEYLVSCGYDGKFAALPVRWQKPIYGPEIPNFTDFAAPGVILTIIFFLGTAQTAGALIIEKKEGLLERTLVNGISATELLFSHVVTLFIVMIAQTIMVLVYCFALYGLTQNGSMWLVILMVILSGLCGMCFGLVISCSCDNERTATYLGLGSFLPVVMLCGIVWPIEAMHNILRLFAFVLPLTKATEALRCILARGWTMEVTEVYSGFISIIIWIFVFLSLSILMLKFKKG